MSRERWMVGIDRESRTYIKRKGEGGVMNGWVDERMEDGGDG